MKPKMINELPAYSELKEDISQGGWGHPACSPGAVEIAEAFPNTHPVRSKK